MCQFDYPSLLEKLTEANCNRRPAQNPKITNEQSITFIIQYISATKPLKSKLNSKRSRLRDLNQLLNSLSSAKHKLQNWRNEIACMRADILVGPFEWQGRRLSLPQDWPLLEARAKKLDERLPEASRELDTLIHTIELYEDVVKKVQAGEVRLYTPNIGSPRKSASAYRKRAAIELVKIYRLIFDGEYPKRGNACWIALCEWFYWKAGVPMAKNTPDHLLRLAYKFPLLKTSTKPGKLIRPESR